MKNDSPNEADAIRSDIDQTRERMDETIDALGNRLKPRHLVDDLLGAFRGPDGENRLHAMRDRVTHTASNAMHSVVDTVKANPIPALLIGAGVAWMIYESRREKLPRDWDTHAGLPEYDPDLHYDRPLEYTATGVEAGQMAFGATGDAGGMEQPSKLGAMKDKAAAAGHTIKEKAASAGHLVREKVSSALHSMGERCSTMGSGAKRRAGVAYTATRERVVTTADQHPLEVGLLCLAAGVIAGLAVPTPERVNRTLGPRADRLRDRAREMGRETLEKGRHVARAAADAAKREAESQGLTPERLRQAGKAVAQSAGQAASETARDEGFKVGAGMPGERREGDAGPQSGSSDPSSARPGV